MDVNFRKVLRIASDQDTRPLWGLWTELYLGKDATGKYAIAGETWPVGVGHHDAVTGIHCLQIAKAIFDRRCKRMSLNY